MNPNEHMNPSEQERTSKRNFLTMGARNVLAIGVLAASAVAARTARAAPDCDGDDSCSCFLAGTKIKTVSGERKVEDLAIGDLLPTVFGGIRPIQWIGFYRYKKSDPSKPWPKDTRPIRIVRSALADDVPHSDLYVTQRHLLLIDDVLVPAGRLLNATTITRHAADEHDELKYFHIKLETHDVIHAQGAPCDSLLTVDDNANNFIEYIRRYGAPETQELPCAPILCVDGRRSEIKSRLRSLRSQRPLKVDVIRERLKQRAMALRARMEAIS